MLEPTTFPTAISLEPSRAAVTLTASSGSEVPKATMVSPMIKLETPSLAAMPLALSTKKSAPFIKKKNPSAI